EIFFDTLFAFLVTMFYHSSKNVLRSSISCCSIFKDRFAHRLRFACVLLVSFASPQPVRHRASVGQL
ncbi:MAG: hypothetical protein ACYCWE_09955, partial [Eubacteriales bacterium]